MRSTKPRSSTGAGVRTASPRNLSDQEEQRDRQRQRIREPSDPVADSRDAAAQDQPGLVAEPAEPAGAPPELAPGHPVGRALQLQGGVRDPRPRGPQAGRLRGYYDVAGLVAS